MTLLIGAMMQVCEILRDLSGNIWPQPILPREFICSSVNLPVGLPARAPLEDDLSLAAAQHVQLVCHLAQLIL